MARSAVAPWPHGLAPDFRDVDVAIARTEPAHQGRAEIRETEALWRAAIADARRFLYIETQYFTSVVIADLVAARLEAEDGPEIVVVLPRECHGWLEQTALADCQARIVRRLGAADRHGRLRFLYPIAPPFANASDDERWVRVHSKLAIATSTSGAAGAAASAPWSAASAPRTFPSWAPLLRLDRIYATHGAALAALEVHRSALARLASDHLPLRAVIEWRRSPL